MKRDINKNDLKRKRKKIFGFNIYAIVTQFIIYKSEVKREKCAHESEVSMKWDKNALDNSYTIHNSHEWSEERKARKRERETR